MTPLNYWANSIRMSQKAEEAANNYLTVDRKLANFVHDKHSRYHPTFHAFVYGQLFRMC